MSTRKDDGPTAAFIWKTVADPFAGRITMFRVVSGTLKADSTVHNVTKDTPERLGHIVLLQGKTQTNVPEIKAGDIGAVAKLKESQTNDLLADKAVTFTLAGEKFPEPVISYAIEPKSRGDEEKISTALHRLQEEDPTINYTRDPQTKELLLAGQGQSHIEVTVAKLKRRFGVEVNLKLPRIPYRETITASTEAHGRHKKQTGGHGQFGDCKVKFEPLPRGTDFEFVNDIFGGSIPRQFVPAIEKGIQDARLRGFLAGYPMVDFRASVFDGSYHPVDSSEMSFKMAGSLAFKDGMSRARPTLLEPIMDVEVYAPSDYAGDLMGDLNGRRGRIGGMDSRGASTDHPREGADVRDADLRAAPHVGDRRPRLLSHGVLALRRSAVAPARQDHRGREGGTRRTKRRKRSSTEALNAKAEQVSNSAITTLLPFRIQQSLSTSPRLSAGVGLAPCPRLPRFSLLAARFGFAFFSVASSALFRHPRPSCRAAARPRPAAGRRRPSASPSRPLRSSRLRRSG